METLQDKLCFTVQSQPFDRIIRSTGFPVVLKYDPSQELDPSLLCPDFDPLSPLYIGSKPDRTPRVHARSATFNANSKCFEDDGLDVVIDEQYPGWFAVFGNPSDFYSDPVVPHFRNIGKLAISPCHAFLVSGDKPLEAVQVKRHVDGTKSLEPFHVKPGTILTKRGMYSVSLKIKVKKSVFKKKVVKKEEMYLGCNDELNNEMMIACQAQGLFYVLTQNSKQVRSPILKMADIVSRYRFPLLVKFVHGDTYQMPSTYKGTFVLLKSDQTEICNAVTIFTEKTMSLEIATDSSIRFFKSQESFEMYTEDAQNLQQRMRFRCNDQGLTSARSSSTSGHGSGFSDDEERFDWLKVVFRSNAPFIEVVNTDKKDRVLFTHHKMDSKHPMPQTQSSKGKDKKIKVETKAIKRTLTYESPSRLNLGIIPITVNNQAKSIHDDTKEHDPLYKNSSSSSSTVTPPVNQGVRENEYGQLWSDTSSQISGESVEFEVENVTITGMTIHDAQERSVSPLDEDTTVHLRNTSSDVDEVDNPYDMLSDTRRSVHDYLTMGQALDSLIDLRSSRTQSEVSETSDATQTLLLRSTEISDVSKYGTYEKPRPYCQNTNTQTLEVADAQPNESFGFIPYYVPNTQTYQDPNYGTYEKPKSFLNTSEETNVKGYERLDTISNQLGTSADAQTLLLRNTQTYEDKYGTYEKPKSIYETPMPNTSEETKVRRYEVPEPTINDQETSGTSTHLRSGDGTYDSNYAGLVSDEEQTQGEEGVYEKVDEIYHAGMSYSAVTPGDASEYISASTLARITRPPSSAGSRLNPDQSVYVNATLEPANCNTLLEKLILNIKTLGLKRATEEAIRNIDVKKFELCMENNSELKEQLSEIFSGINKIDLNKISLFLDTVQKT